MALFKHTFLHEKKLVNRKKYVKISLNLHWKGTGRYEFENCSYL